MCDLVLISFRPQLAWILVWIHLVPFGSRSRTNLCIGSFLMRNHLDPGLDPLGSIWIQKSQDAALTSFPMRIRLVPCLVPLGSIWVQKLHDVALTSFRLQLVCFHQDLRKSGARNQILQVANPEVGNLNISQSDQTGS